MCLKVIDLNTNIYERKMFLIHYIPTSITIIMINFIIPSSLQ